jgi:hypothetical protein
MNQTVRGRIGNQRKLGQAWTVWADDHPDQPEARISRPAQSPAEYTPAPAP